MINNKQLYYIGNIIMMKLIICSIPSIIFLMIGVNARKETKAVCFFKFTKRPIVYDVKRYNLAISNLWIAAACILELSCVFALFCIQDSSIFEFITFAEIVLILGMVALYFKIQKKYKKLIIGIFGEWRIHDQKSKRRRRFKSCGDPCVCETNEVSSDISGRRLFIWRTAGAPCSEEIP